MKNSIIGLSIFMVLSVILAACSTVAPVVNSAVVESKPGAASVSSNVNVEIKGFAFSPKEMTVKIGTRVTWTNLDNAGHDVKATDGSWGSDTLTNGQTFSMVFDKEGTFAYVCTFHSGMTGTIIVTK